MADYLISVLLGIIEGLTEFLPISSTAHLRIAEAFLHIDLHDGFWKMYTIVIQLGAILALPVYFRTAITQFLASFPKGERGDRNLLTHPLSLTMIAFVVTAVPSWLLKKQIGENLENLKVMAWAILIGGVLAFCQRCGGTFKLKQASTIVPDSRGLNKQHVPFCRRCSGAIR